jgi:hypothetical protein
MKAPNAKRFLKVKSDTKPEPPAGSQRFLDLKKSHASSAHADHAPARPSFAGRLNGRGLGKEKASGE